MADASLGHDHFSDPDDYQASFPGVKIRLFFTHPGEFKARLTSARLPHLILVRANESRPRLAHLLLRPDRTAVVFPTRLHPVQTWDGSIMGSRSFVIHGPGGRLYQWTRGASNLGLIILPTEYLLAQSSWWIAVQIAPARFGLETAPICGRATSAAPLEGVPTRPPQAGRHSM